MSAKDTGGNAFPVPGDQPDESFNGMSLRDYFAAKALQGLLASPQITGNGGLDNWPDQSFAQFAYRLADSMLAERAK